MTDLENNYLAHLPASITSIEVYSNGEDSNTTSVSIADRDCLVREHLPLVKVIAVRLAASLPGHVDLNALVQAGAIGLISAATKFGSHTKVLFQNYARFRIKGEMLDCLRRQDGASREMRRPTDAPR